MAREGGGEETYLINANLSIFLDIRTWRRRVDRFAQLILLFRFRL